MQMKEKKPSLGINAILNSIRSVMSIIYPLITYPYVTRLLQAENLGKVNFASSLVGYFSLIAVLGITSYAAREGVQYRNSKEKLNQFSSEMFTLNLFTTLVALMALAIVCAYVPKFHEYIGLICIYSTTIIFGAIGLPWLYTIEEDYLYITVKSIVIQGVSLILLFILVRKPDDLYMYAALNAFSNVGSNLFNVVYCKKYINLKICFDLKKVFGHLKSCIIFFSSSIASSIYSNIDTTMLGFYSTDYRIGIYSAAVKIYVMIKTLLNAVITVVIPRLTLYKAEDKLKDFNILISRLFKIMITILFPIVIGIIIVSKELAICILGKGFEESQYSLSILAVAVFFSIFATLINGCILIPCKKETQALITTVGAALVNIVTNFGAIPLWQEKGAAITTVISEAVVLLLGWHYAKSLVQLENMKRTFITSSIGCLIMFFVAIGMNSLIANMLIMLICKVLCCALVYFTVLIVLKNEIMLDLIKFLKNRYC